MRPEFVIPPPNVGVVAMSMAVCFEDSVPLLLMPPRTAELPNTAMPSSDGAAIEPLFTTAPVTVPLFMSIPIVIELIVPVPVLVTLPVTAAPLMLMQSIAAALVTGPLLVVTLMVQAAA